MYELEQLKPVVISEGALLSKELLGPNHLGGKGFGLCEMHTLGLPVPPGIIVPTTVCTEYYAKDESMRVGFIAEYVHTEVMPVLAALEIGEDVAPVYSVRSGARVSLPGMMETLLNVGINAGNLSLLVERVGKHIAHHSYASLLRAYGVLVYGLDKDEFYDPDKEEGEEYGNLEDIIKWNTKVYAEYEGTAVPGELRTQLVLSICAVFDSWYSDKAKHYRSIHGYKDEWGTTATIQLMVFGNGKGKCASGVVFTRNPITGNNKLMGEFMPNTQGEPVVSGVIKPKNITKMRGWHKKGYNRLCKMLGVLEKHCKDMLEVEFTEYKGKVWLLQYRVGKRSAEAAFRIARDLHKEGVIDKHTALSRVTFRDYADLLVSSVDPAFKVKPDDSGTPASGGIVTGVAVLSSEAALKSDVPCILVRDTTETTDIEGMTAAIGIITRLGGLTCHAAVVARGLHIPCVVGVKNIPLEVEAGDMITMDGSTGKIWRHVCVPLTTRGITKAANEVISWYKPPKHMVRMTAEKGGTVPISFPLYIDTLKIQGGYEGWAELFASLEHTTKTIILNLETYASVMYRHDHELQAIAHGNVDIEDALLVATREVINTMEVKAQVSAKQKGHIYLDMPGYSNAQVALMEALGWQVVTEAYLVGDIIHTKGMLKMAKHACISRHDAESIVALRKGSCSMMDTPLYAEDIIVKALT